jgi:hypothetical protein
LWAPHLLAAPAIVIGRRKKGKGRVIIISHFQVERETRQVQFYQGRKRIETLSSRDACGAGLILGLRVCCASGSATSSMLWRVCWWLTLPKFLPCHALDICEIGYCIKQADQVGARAVQGATLSVGDRRCHQSRVGASSPRSRPLKIR